MIRQKLAAPTGGGGALVTRLAASQSSQRRVHAAHSTPCLRLALLACVLGSACAVAPGVVGAQSSLPVPSRTIALDRLRAMRIAALSTPTDASVLPILADEPISAEDVAYPGPLTAPERILRAATFWSRALPVVISYLQLQASFNVRERMLGRALEPAETDALWNEAHTVGAATLKATIEQLKGFYVKTGQIIAARVDLFPTQYTDALSGLTDYLDPMPASLVRRVIQQELLTGSETFDEVFAWFDDAPLGAASIAQVHHARLTPKYGGMEVAVKVQRPAIEPKLLGDIANLKALAKGVRSVPSIPVDYYVVFSELEAQLADEFDFVKEATAMERIADALEKTADGQPCAPPVRIPRPIAPLITRRVLVMEFMDGVPLSRAKAEMERRGVDPDGPEARLFARKLLRALTDAFGRSILETGFFHADPHAGNLVIMADGSIGLIDFGQVKQISGRAREALAKVIVALADRKSDTDPAELDLIGKLSLELGVVLKPGAKPEGPAATAMWLFDGSVTKLPGGYDMGELSPNSPVKELQSFPQDLVLVGRATVLIKGIAARLGVRWSLAREWAPTARQVLQQKDGIKRAGRTRFRTVVRTIRQWAAGRAEKASARLPPTVRRRLAGAVLRLRRLRGLD